MDAVSDFQFAVDYVVKTHPDHTIFAVGHSYGANTLVNVIWNNEKWIVKIFSIWQSLRIIAQ